MDILLCSDRNSLHRQARTAAEPLIQGFDQTPNWQQMRAPRDLGLAERRRQTGVTNTDKRDRNQ
jgi:hypothetical protein